MMKHFWILLVFSTGTACKQGAATDSGGKSIQQQSAPADPAPLASPQADETTPILPDSVEPASQTQVELEMWTETTDLVGLPVKLLAPAGSQTTPSQGQISTLESAKIVIGGESRERIVTTQSYPFATVGFINSGCTGVLVGPRHVLTAAHCLYDVDRGRVIRGLAVAFGRDETSEPFGRIKAVRYVIPKLFRENRDYRFDYGIMILADRIGERLGWVGVKAEEQSKFSQHEYFVASYPSDLGVGEMWGERCSAINVTALQFDHACDTAFGSSGSPFMISQGQDVFSLGLHSHTTNDRRTNKGVRAAQGMLTTLQLLLQTHP